MEDLLSYNFNVKSSFRNYEVQFIQDLDNTFRSVKSSGDIVLIDKIVYERFFRKYGEDADFIIIEASEPQKSYEGLIPIISDLINKGFRKNNRLIAVGGGVVQDITAFIASIIYRGVDWFFFPTTLLAQGDSCIGSKTSINFKEFKNQLGNFYPPSQIYIYKEFIDSLPERDVISGIGEMCHYFLVSGKEDFIFFKDHFKDKSFLLELISRSLKIKKSYIERDEFDKGPRQVFNYGHTFGHAIESLSNYAVPHGLAVSRGMDMANYTSFKKGYISGNQFMEMHQLLFEIWKNIDFGQIDKIELIDAMKKDKKNKDGQLGLILTRGMGDMFKDFTEPDDKFTLWMSEYLKLTEKGLIKTNLAVQ